jgi:hypothetical protein
MMAAWNVFERLRTWRAWAGSAGSPIPRETGSGCGSPPDRVFSRAVTAAPPMERARWARRLLRCGVAAGPAFAAVFLAEGATRDGYHPLRHPVSSLALGSRGWVQTSNFSVAGALCLAGAAGLRLAGDQPGGSRSVGPAMVAAAGAGLLGSAAFATDPVGGYPPGTPDTPAEFSRAGAAHNLCAVPVFLGLPAAAAYYGWRSRRAGQPPGFAVYCAATAAAMPVAAALAGAGFGQPAGLGRYGGLFQRASIMVGFGWLTIVSARGLRRARPDGDDTSW